ncbi:hypothetical protein EVJ58_g3184 [Rhodofomes roseus]|uniref:C2H2-type domain-containing protein n=1 Tax=Rhodofomes roseus TaxID=34475 RepID=A0A4Y9YPX1_9APHY|nr:hypothetical protein EVJ58_g3184 [Rhodofomes roseus]
MQYDSDQGVYTSSAPGLLLSAEPLLCGHDSLPRDCDGFAYGNWSADEFLPYPDVGLDPLMDKLRGPSDILTPYLDLSHLDAEAALHLADDIHPLVEGSSTWDYPLSTSTWPLALQSAIAAEPPIFPACAPDEGPSNTSLNRSSTTHTVPATSFASSSLQWLAPSSSGSPSEVFHSSDYTSTSLPVAANETSAPSDRSRSSKRRSRINKSCNRHGHADLITPGTVPSHASSFAGGVRRTSPRNKQVGFVPYARIDMREGSGFICLHCEPDRPFSTQRKGDLKRHVLTHFAHSRGQELICCGVPEEDAPELVGERYEHGGRRMVGGCLKTFSRRDSFLRHLRKARCLRPAHM